MYFTPFFLISVFVTSCQTTSEHVNDNLVETVKTAVNAACFENNNPSFLVHISAPNMPSVSWEGQWSSDYRSLQTQLLDPTGKEMQLASLSVLVDKFGAIGLRRVMCGQTAFSSRLPLQNHQIVVKNRIKILQQTSNTIQFEAVSQFYYGLFGMKKDPNTLYWRGFVEKSDVTPQLIRFGVNKEFLQLDFLDYN